MKVVVFMDMFYIILVCLIIWFQINNKKYMNPCYINNLNNIYEFDKSKPY